ncbi:hypothetical protein CB1_000318024 [Camelus ferus]|nr:hypothetical protein CB1_000318024 [Camelus ferus]
MKSGSGGEVIPSVALASLPVLWLERAGLDVRGEVIPSAALASLPILWLERAGLDVSKAARRGHFLSASTLSPYSIPRLSSTKQDQKGSASVDQNKRMIYSQPPAVWGPVCAVKLRWYFTVLLVWCWSGNTPSCTVFLEAEALALPRENMDHLHGVEKGNVQGSILWVSSSSHSPVGFRRAELGSSPEVVIGPCSGCGGITPRVLTPPGKTLTDCPLLGVLSMPQGNPGKGSSSISSDVSSSTDHTPTQAQKNVATSEDIVFKKHRQDLQLKDLSDTDF